jgi:hypothetical protein
MKILQIIIFIFIGLMLAWYLQPINILKIIPETIIEVFKQKEPAETFINNTCEVLNGTCT